MKKSILTLSVFLVLNIILTFWIIFQYNNAPPLEENVRVRIGQSDRFIAENSNKIEQMKSEVNTLNSEINELKNALTQQQAQIHALEMHLKNK